MRKLDKKVIKNQINATDHTYLAAHLGSNKLSPTIVEEIIAGINEGCTVTKIHPDVNNDIPSPVRNNIPWRNPPRLAPRNRRANSLSLPASPVSSAIPYSCTDSRTAQPPTATTYSSASASLCDWSIPLFSKKEVKSLKSSRDKGLSSWSRYQGECGSGNGSKARDDIASKSCSIYLQKEVRSERGGGRDEKVEENTVYHQFATTSCCRSFSTDSNLYKHGLGSQSMDSVMYKGYSDEYNQKKSRHGYNVFRQLSNNFESKIVDTEEDQEAVAHNFRKFHRKDSHEVIISPVNPSIRDGDDVVSNRVDIQNLEQSLKLMPQKNKFRSVQSHNHHTASQAIPLPSTLENKSSVLRAVFQSQFHRKKGGKNVGEC